MYQPIKPTLTLTEKVSGEELVLVARFGDQVHIRHPRGGFNALLAEARSLVQSHDVQITSAQAEVLEMEASNG